MAKTTRAITEINTAIIHCAASPNGRAFVAKDINSWHQERGFKRTAAVAKTYNPELLAIGYHYVITIDGTIQTGRAITEIGAHAQNHNQTSVGICIIGTDKFTQRQWEALAALITTLQHSLPIQKIIGHYQVEPHKTCPCFDVPAWLADSMRAPQAHVLTIPQEKKS